MADPAEKRQEKRSQSGQASTEIMLLISCLIVGVIGAAHSFVQPARAAIADLAADIDTILAEHRIGGMGLPELPELPNLTAHAEPPPPQEPPPAPPESPPESPEDRELRELLERFGGSEIPSEDIPVDSELAGGDKTADQVEKELLSLIRDSGTRIQ